MFNSKSCYSYLNFLIDCSANSKELLATLWDLTVSHAATFTVEVFIKGPLDIWRS